MKLREIHTIWLREIKIALADKWAIAIGIGWPLFLIFIIGIGVDSFVDLKELGVSYTELLGPGVIAILSMGGAMGIGNSIIEDRKGFVKELLVSPISRSSIFIGKILGEMTINLLMALIVVILFLAFTKELTFISLIWTLGFMLLLAFGFYGFGIVLSSLFKKSKSYQIITGLVMTAMIFLSGTFFPINNLPDILRFFVNLNPLTYGVDGLRNILIGFSEFNLIFDLLVLIVFGVIMVILGSYLFKKSVEK